LALEQSSQNLFSVKSRANHSKYAPRAEQSRANRKKMVLEQSRANRKKMVLEQSRANDFKKSADPCCTEHRSQDYKFRDNNKAWNNQKTKTTKNLQGQTLWGITFSQGVTFNQWPVLIVKNQLWKY
jgi:hypothetical protein